MEKIYSKEMESGEKRGELKSEGNSPFHGRRGYGRKDDCPFG